MSRTGILATTVVCSALLNAQTATYKDVALIINSNSAVSDSIGSYFAHARNIPEKNIIRVTAPCTEEIDDLQFEALRNQIESFLTSNAIADSINYIVTTKGFPLKVNRASAGACSSVESDLALILGPYAQYIGRSGSIGSPYYRQTADFLRSKYHFFLVTRLDGYTFSDVKGIIDRTSAIGTGLPPDAQFVFDIDPLWNSQVPSLNANLSRIAQTLSSRGFTVNLDSTATFLTHQTNVMGYTSWGSNDHHPSTHAIVGNTWAPGAIAETYVSTSGRSFSTPPQYGQSLIADLIAEGITAAKGYVYEPYASAMADVSVLFDRYVSGYTIAESYYAASPYLSWMDVVVGDPKFRLTSSRLPFDYDPSIYNEGSSALPIEIATFMATPNGSAVELAWGTVTETNFYGFEVQRKESRGSAVGTETSVWNVEGFIGGYGTTNAPRKYSFTDKVNLEGHYMYRLKLIDRDGSFSYSAEVQAEVASAPSVFSLSQNYPNPFNPTTRIEFTVPFDGKATVSVYNVVGQNVATLYEGVAKAGEYQHVMFDASGLSSGVYFAVLQSGGKELLKKMLFVK